MSDLAVVHGLEEPVQMVREYLATHPDADYLMAAYNVCLKLGDRPPERIGHEGWPAFIEAVKEAIQK